VWDPQGRNPKRSCGGTGTRKSEVNEMDVIDESVVQRMPDDRDAIHCLIQTTAVSFIKYSQGLSMINS